MPYAIGLLLLVIVLVFTTLVLFIEWLGWVWIVFGAGLITLVFKWKKSMGAKEARRILEDQRAQMERLRIEKESEDEKQRIVQEAERKKQEAERKKRRCLANEAKKQLRDEMIEASRVRREGLLAKYENEETVQRILNGECWIGQSVDQLTDALGIPLDRELKMSARSTRETWKYQSKGVNRYALRVVVKNGVVTGIHDNR